MKRRKFIQSTALASTIPLSYASAGQNTSQSMDDEKELYEIRTYEMKFRGNRKMLISYLKEALHPAMQRVGVNHFMLFNELGKSDPSKIWVLISYPNANIYLEAQTLNSDSEFTKAAMKYNELPVDTPYSIVIHQCYCMLLMEFLKWLTQLKEQLI